MDYVEKEETPEKIKIGEAKGYISFQEVTCYVIFDVKMDFLRNSQMAENGAMTEANSRLTDSSFV